MVNLLTGPKGSGKTQQMIEQANKQAKECRGNVVFIKKTHRDTASVAFDTVQFVWMIFHLLRIPMSTLVSYMECIAPTTILSAFLSMVF